MRLPALTAMTLVAAASALAGCTSHELWRTGQQWQKQACTRLPDLEERKRCEHNAAAAVAESRAGSAASAKKPAP